LFLATVPRDGNGDRIFFARNQGDGHFGAGLFGFEVDVKLLDKAGIRNLPPIDLPGGHKQGRPRQNQEISDAYPGEALASEQNVDVGERSPDPLELEIRGRKIVGRSKSGRDRFGEGFARQVRGERMDERMSRRARHKVRKTGHHNNEYERFLHDLKQV
jgi:hypothetical protein